MCDHSYKFLLCVMLDKRLDIWGLSWCAVLNCLVVSSSLQTHGLQHARFSCPLSPRVCSNWCPLSQWCHPTISSSVIPLFLLPSILPSIRVFSDELTLRIRWPKQFSFSFSVSPPNEYSGWFPLGLTGLIFLQSQGLSRVLSSTTVWKYQFYNTQYSLWSNSHICTWLLETP